MTSVGSDGTSHAGSPTSSDSDACEAAETAMTRALAGLDNLRELPLSEHVERFEAVHSALTEALTSAERLSSPSNSRGG